MIANTTAQSATQMACVVVKFHQDISYIISMTRAAQVVSNQICLVAVMSNLQNLWSYISGILQSKPI